MKSLFVVCTGNMCRSPIAVGVLRLKLLGAGLHNQVDVTSVGTKAREGYFASRYTTDLLINKGIPIRSHRTRCLQVEDLEVADLVLVMEETHRSHIFHMAPGQLHKVWLFSELAGKTDDIADPMGGGKEAYSTVLKELDQFLSNGWSQLLRLLNLCETNQSTAATNDA